MAIRPIAQLKWVENGVLLTLSCFEHSLWMNLDLWLIFLSDSYLKGNRMVSGILPYACKAYQVHCPIHQTNLLPAGERDVLVLHLTLILAGKC